MSRSALSTAAAAERQKYVRLPRRQRSYLITEPHSIVINGRRERLPLHHVIGTASISLIELVT